MKCFVTGGRGFSGSALLRLLEAEGYETGGISSRSHSGPGDLQACDLLDFERVKGLVAGFKPDLVFHLAALSNPSQSWENPRRYLENNIQGTVNLLEAIRTQCPGARLLLVSSSHVYAPPPDGRPLSEEAALQAASPYACSKLVCEEIARHYCEKLGLKVVIARPFNHSGPGQSPDFVISDFCRQIAEVERTPNEWPRLVRVGNLEPVRDFLDVRDVVRAYLLLALKGQVGQAYNVCSGQGTSIRTILETALSLARATIQAEEDSQRRRKGEPDAVVGDSSKLRKLGGWAPSIGLRETVQAVLESWR